MASTNADGSSRPPARTTAKMVSPGGHTHRHVPKQPKGPLPRGRALFSRRRGMRIETRSGRGGESLGRWLARRLEALALVDDVPAEDPRRRQAAASASANPTASRTSANAGARRRGRGEARKTPGRRSGVAPRWGVARGRRRVWLESRVSGVVFRRRLRLREGDRRGNVVCPRRRRWRAPRPSRRLGSARRRRLRRRQLRRRRRRRGAGRGEPRASAETVRVGSEGERLVAADPGEGLVLEPVGEGAGVRARPAGVRFSGEEIAERGGAAGDRGRRVAVRRAGTGRCWGHRGEAARGSGGRQRPLGNAAASGRDRRAAIVTRATPACIRVT